MHELEKFYSGAIEKQKKSAIVIRHDAIQLAILHGDIVSNRRSIFVTADQSLRLALGDSEFSHLASSMFSHIGLAQLVDLLVGQVPEARGLSSLMWMSTVSSETERIRNYLLDLGLAEHNAAIAMKISDVVDEISEDAALDLQNRGLSIEATDEGGRKVVNTTLERYEKDFFRKMEREIRRGRAP